MKYVGYYTDSKKVFDSTGDNPITVQCNDETYVEGFRVGLEKMRKGEKARLTMRKDCAFRYDRLTLRVPPEYKDRRDELCKLSITYEIEILDLVQRRDVTINEGSFIKTIIKDHDRGYIGDSYYVYMDIKVTLNNEAKIDKQNWIVCLKSKEIPYTVCRLISNMHTNEESTAVAKWDFLQRCDQEVIKRYGIKEGEELHLHVKPYLRLCTRGIYKNDAAILCVLRRCKGENHPVLESNVSVYFKVIVNNKNLFSNFHLQPLISKKKYFFMQLGPDQDPPINLGKPLRIMIGDYVVPSLVKKAILNLNVGEICEMRYHKRDKLVDGLSEEIFKSEWFQDDDDIRVFIYLKSFKNPQSIKKVKVVEKMQRIAHFKKNAGEFYKRGMIRKAGKLYKKILNFFKQGDTEAADTKEKDDQSFSNIEEELNEIKKACMTNLILCKFKRKKYKHTIALAEEAIKENPKNAKLYFYLAKSQYETNDFIYAMESIRKAKAIEPNNQDIINEEDRINIEYKKLYKSEKDKYSKMFSKKN